MVFNCGVWHFILKLYSFQWNWPCWLSEVRHPDIPTLDTAHRHALKDLCRVLLSRIKRARSSHCQVLVLNLTYAHSALWEKTQGFWLSGSILVFEDSFLKWLTFHQKDLTGSYMQRSEQILLNPAVKWTSSRSPLPSQHGRFEGNGFKSGSTLLFSFL